MRKVAKTHFALTVFLFLAALVFGFVFPHVQIGDFWMIAFLILQPHFLLLAVLNTNPGGGILDAIEFWGCVIAIPIWSICFGWLNVKFKNWLNHFPVLGKRVF